jgi:hypothetical protein
MKIAIMIYILIGIVLCFVGPIAKKIRETRSTVFNDSLEQILLKSKKIPKWKKYLKITFIYLISIIFWVVLIFIYIIAEPKKTVFINDIPTDNTDYDDESDENLTSDELDIWKKFSPILNTSSDKRDKNFFYFSRGSGAGIIICDDCGNNYNIICFTHGGSSHFCATQTFQCQKCGKLVNHTSEGELSTPNNCECGGEMSREEPVFCPICKSKNVQYRMKYMT